MAHAGGRTRHRGPGQAVVTPDLLPGSAELEDPSELLGTAPGGDVEPDEIDIALEKLLAEENHRGEDTQG